MKPKVEIRDREPAMARGSKNNCLFCTHPANLEAYATDGETESIIRCCGCPMCVENAKEVCMMPFKVKSTLIH